MHRFQNTAPSLTVVLGVALALTLAGPVLAATTGMNSTSGNLPIGAGGNTVITVTPDGKVGIGTQTPRTTLDVNGAIKLGSVNTPCDANHRGAIRLNTNANSGAVQAGQVFEACLDPAKGWDQWALAPIGTQAGQCDYHLNRLYPGFAMRANILAIPPIFYTQGGCDCPSGWTLVDNAQPSVGDPNVSVPANATPNNQVWYRGDMVWHNAYCVKGERKLVNGQWILKY